MENLSPPESSFAPAPTRATAIGRALTFSALDDFGNTIRIRPVNHSQKMNSEPNFTKKHMKKNP
jgi:hypothetical protein